MPLGRPPLTLDDLPEGWKETMLTMARDGASRAEMRAFALNGISPNTWTALEQREPEFEAVCHQCKILSQGWWERQGRLGLHDGMNATTYIFNMTNRFGDEWKHKTDSSVSGEMRNVNTSLTPEEYAAISAKKKAEV